MIRLRNCRSRVQTRYKIKLFLVFPIRTVTMISKCLMSFFFMRSQWMTR